MGQEEVIFKGTPDQWWEQAQPIMKAEADNRNLGDWYIVKQRHANGSGHSYRLMTPARPYNSDQFMKALKAPGGNETSTRVRKLIATNTPLPKWRTAEIVMADFELQDGGIKRFPWSRKSNGRWHSLYDGRVTVNDQTMEGLNPAPAKIIEEEN